MTRQEIWSRIPWKTLLAVLFGGLVAFGFAGSTPNDRLRAVEQKNTQQDASIAELRYLLEDTRRWTWCSLNSIEPEACGQIPLPQVQR